MKILRGRENGVPSEPRSDTFTGTVWMEPVLAPADGVAVNTVFFPPRARTHWHRHTDGQLLLVTHGRGYVESDPGGGAWVSPGDVVYVPPGERHWHGAGPESYLVHMAVSLGTTEWFTEVTDEHYRSLPAP